jgi:hypothetical protein
VSVGIAAKGAGPPVNDIGLVQGAPPSKVALAHNKSSLEFQSERLSGSSQSEEDEDEAHN